MQIFDLNKMKAFPYAEREKNVFFKAEKFKTRIIELPAGGSMPDCEMASYVIFYILEGSVAIYVNEEKQSLSKGQCLITESAKISMESKNGVKILGIQISIK